MNKLERQNRLIQEIQQSNKITASELAKRFKVSKRTILRDIDDLENQGVQIHASHGSQGGYKIQESQSKIALTLTDAQLSALFLTLNESQSYSTLPYAKEIQAILKQCLSLPQTRIRKLLKKMDYYIKFEDTTQVTLPNIFSDILIYCSERKVMLVDFYEEDRTVAENVIFIGLLCKDGQWHAIVFEIGLGSTRELLIRDIQDISYSFEKTIKTQDITIDNYQQFLSDTTRNIKNHS
ncbi:MULTISPECIES: helix-turn-helix transcriptional regulator [Staphylococcus]|uniref:helix-turn-helix transcriptional regulator n=1 Tax=Staphylococcus TaxID=1279 RepID=UPI000301C5DF|nr:MULTISPECIES: HTH domain-containing protein [Staphylococcus]MBM6508195.1 HTH domain-containing protein [Staphylococcus pasteuri]PTU81745.1 HTH domain-containing protein [Staphylococcus pasteuri]PTU81978.1 HTH domain-containing protein [Staphylococcus pasteuri]QQT20244.1 HTH domain-containing protein [Staphylococcus pasteuri]RIO33534.1 HTH domain-containing protein [Staphylococcus pasteuri]